MIKIESAGQTDPAPKRSRVPEQITLFSKGIPCIGSSPSIKRRGEERGCWEREELTPKGRLLYSRPSLFIDRSLHSWSAGYPLGAQPCGLRARAHVWAITFRVLLMIMIRSTLRLLQDFRVFPSKCIGTVETSNRTKFRQSGMIEFM